MNIELEDRLRSAYKNAIEMGHVAVVAIHVGEEVWAELRQMVYETTPIEKWTNVITSYSLPNSIWGIPMIREQSWKNASIEVRARKPIA